MPTNPTSLSPLATPEGDGWEQSVHDGLLSVVTKLMLATAAEPEPRTVLMREARLELDALLPGGLHQPDGGNLPGGPAGSGQR